MVCGAVSDRLGDSMKHCRVVVEAEIKQGMITIDLVVHLTLLNG